MRRFYPQIGLLLAWLGIVLCAVASPDAQAQTVTCTPVVQYGQEGEVYERNNTRLGSGFKNAAECPAYVTEELRKRALARGPGVYEDGLFCKGVTYVTNKCTVTAAPVVVTPPPTTPGIGRLPDNPYLTAGWDFDRVSATSEVANAAGDGQGDFRTRCLPSHFAFDDPIVFPGQAGRSHLHVFFGNTGASAKSTAESLRNSGNSTCRGGTVNRSSYWVPAVIDTTTMLPVKPDESDFYYKTAYKGVKNADIQPMPVGLRMIAGDPANKVENPYTSIYVFLCHNTAYPSNRSQNIPATCPPGDQLELSIAFPQCWDGVNLDSPDHKSHMAYANGGCPASHPVALPEVSFHVLWPVPANGDLRAWRLSSDTNGYPSGLSAHADWFNGWKKEFSDSWAINCDRAGKDCHSHLLGDGRAIY